MRGRLQGGKLNKAKKGELRRPLPVGLRYHDEGQTVFDPDEEARGAVRLLFETFRQTGSAYGGVWDGKLIWGHPCHSRVLGLLRDPACGKRPPQRPKIGLFSRICGLMGSCWGSAPDPGIF